MSGNDTTNFDNDTSGNHGVPFDTSPDLSGDQGRFRGPHPEDTMQDSTRSRGFQPLGHGTDATQKDIPDETQQEFHSPSDGETQRDYSADRTEQDIRNQKTADHGGQKTDQDIGAGQQKVWADPFQNTQPTDWEPLDGSKSTAGEPSASPLKHSRSSASQPPPSQQIGPIGRFRIGDMFANKYEITGHIGQGGMGTVYKALDLVLGRSVAIKFLKTKSIIDKTVVSRFQQEAVAIASLDHHNIIRVHEMSVTSDGDPFFVLEYIQGNSLSNEIRGLKSLPLERALAIAEQICDALQHAHDHGVVHRDLKPSNLMLVKHGEVEVVKLLDFGIAKLNPMDEETLLRLTKTGELFGSPHYMSPEQCSGETVDAPSDIYSLGIVLFEMLTGKPPFSGNSPFATIEMHKLAATPSIVGSIDEGSAKLLDPILAKMMAKNPSDRYEKPADVKAELQSLGRALFAPATQVSIQLPVDDGYEKRKKNLALITLGVVAVLGSGAAIGLSLGWNVAPPVVAAKVDKTPWSSYDYKGQRMFDVGNYKDASEYFHKAHERALTVSEPRRSILVDRSLRELRMISSVLKDKAGVESANKLLLNLTLQEKVTSTDFSELQRAVASAIHAEDSSELQTQLDLLHRALPKLRAQGIDVLQYLSSLEKKLILSERLQLSLVYVQLLSAAVQIENENDDLPQLASIIDAASKFEGRLSPTQAYLAGDLSMRVRGSSNLTEHLLQYAYDYGDQLVQSKAVLVQARLYFETGRKTAAINRLSAELGQLEKRSTTEFAWLYVILLDLSSMLAHNAEAEKALPLLIRARSIAQYELDDFRFYSGGSSKDLIDYRLVNLYTDLNDFDSAIDLLDSMAGSISDAEAGDLQKVRWYAKYGRVLCKQRRFDQAIKRLKQAEELIAKQKQPNGEMRFISQQVSEDLALIASH